MFLRGSVYYGNLGTNGEGVQSGVRPLLVVQNDTGNRHAKTTIVVPITTKQKRKMPTHFNIQMGKVSIVLCEQITIVHKSQLFDHIYTLTDTELAELDKALMASLGIKNGGI